MQEVVAVDRHVDVAQDVVGGREHREDAPEPEHLVWGLWLRVEGVGLRVQGSRAYSSGLRDEGSQV